MATTGKTLARIIVATAADERERKAALSLQVYAWRQVALIGLVDPQRGATLAKTLFMQSVPFVNGDYVQKLIDETRDEATKAGKKAGVFG